MPDGNRIAISKTFIAYSAQHKHTLTIVVWLTMGSALLSIYSALASFSSSYSCISYAHHRRYIVYSSCCRVRSLSSINGTCKSGPNARLSIILNIIFQIRLHYAAAVVAVVTVCCCHVLFTSRLELKGYSPGCMCVRTAVLYLGIGCLVNAAFSSNYIEHRSYGFFFLFKITY